MGSAKFRIEFLIHSCESVESVVLKIKEKYSLKQESFKHFFKRYDIKNTFTLEGIAKVYLNYDMQTDYVYLAFEGYFSNWEECISLAYMLYVELHKFFPISIKLDTCLNEAHEEISYDQFNKSIEKFYK